MDSNTITIKQQEEEKESSSLPNPQNRNENENQNQNENRNQTRLSIFLCDNHFQESINVSPYSTVYGVKQTIQAMIGVPPDQQILFRHPEYPPLQDHLTLQLAKVTNFSILWLLSPALTITLVAPQSTSPALPLLKVYASDTVLSIKDSIFTSLGVPPHRITLLFSGVTLFDLRSLASYRIPRQATLYAIIGPEAHFVSILRLVVESVFGRFEIFVKPWYTVLNVKTVIESRSGAPVSIQELVYLGKKLRNWSTVEVLGLYDNATIRVNLVGRPVMLYIAPLGRGVEEIVIGLEAVSTDTANEVIDKLPERVVESIGGEPGIFLGEKRLAGGKTLAHYGIETGTLLSLERVITIHVHIPIPMPRGEVIKVEFKASEQVFDVKCRIELLCGIFVEMQSLTYRGDKIDDDMTLEECEDQVGSLWNLRWKLASNADDPNAKSYSFFWPCFVP